MKRYVQSVVAALCVVAVCLSLGGCGPGLKETEQVQATVEGAKLSDLITPISPPAKVSVGLKNVVADAGILVGQAKGYYKELGIEIEPLEFTISQDMTSALAAGQLDVGLAVTASGLFNAMLRQMPLKIVACKGHNIPGQGYYRFVIRKDLVDEIKDFEDLRGKKLACVGTASMDEVALNRVLCQGGMTTADVDMHVIQSFADIVAALSNKSIDGGILLEPLVTQAVKLGIADPWKDPEEYNKGAQVAVLAYGKSVMERPEVAKAFMVAYVQSMRDYNDGIFHGIDKDAIIDILVEYSTVKDRSLYVDMYPTGLNPDGYVRMEGIQMDLDWYKAQGLLKGDLAAEDVVDNSYVDYALEILGKYDK